MRFKSILISVLIIITGGMSFLLSKLLQLYRVHVFLYSDSSAAENEKFQTIIRYENITWGLIAVIIFGLIILIGFENKEKIGKVFKNLYK